MISTKKPQKTELRRSRNLRLQSTPELDAVLRAQVLDELVAEYGRSSSTVQREPAPELPPQLSSEPKYESNHEPQASADEAPEASPAEHTERTVRTVRPVHSAPSRGSGLLRLAAIVSAALIVVFLYVQTSKNRQSAASMDDVTAATVASIDLTEMQQADAQMIRRLYGFTPSDFEGCVLYYPTSNMGAEELLIVKLSDLSQQELVTAAIAARTQSQMKSFEGYGIEQYALLSKAVTEVQGNFILYVVHPDAAAASSSFLNSL